MLDANLIKFVEPIGPGQIVDRESLVALPVGQLQITIETNQERVIVRILAMRGADDALLDDDQSLSWNVSAYIWQNGQVIAGEKHADSEPTNRTTRPKLATIGRKRSPGTKNFKFAKEPSEHEEDKTVVDAILQVCVYKLTNGAVHRKAFLGTVHIALNYLTSDEFEANEDGATCRDEWFKVFPKSTFLPGCPSSIAKTNCAISGYKPRVEDQQKTVPPRHRQMVRSASTISYKQYDLAIRPRADSNASTTLSERSVTSTRTQPGDPTNVKSRITTWVKKKLLRQATDPVLNTGHRRTPDSAKPEIKTDEAPVIVGPRRRAFTSPSRISTSMSSASTETPPIQKSSPTARLPVPTEVRSAKSKARRNCYAASTSNHSSFDVGYESGRSRCVSSSDEEASHRSAESNLDTLCETRSRIGAGCKLTHEAQVHTQKCTPHRPVTQKQRPAVLRRTSRISNSDGFTSLNEIRRQNSKASLDSAICANS